MNRDAVIKAFGAIDPESAVWRAVLTVLDGTVTDETAHVAVPDLSPDSRSFNCGRLAMAMDTASSFREWMAESKRLGEIE